MQVCKNNIYQKLNDAVAVLILQHLRRPRRDDGPTGGFHWWSNRHPTPRPIHWSTKDPWALDGKRSATFEHVFWNKTDEILGWNGCLRPLWKRLPLKPSLPSDTPNDRSSQTNRLHLNLIFLRRLLAPKNVRSRTNLCCWWLDCGTRQTRHRSVCQTK